MSKYSTHVSFDGNGGWSRGGTARVKIKKDGTVVAEGEAPYYTDDAEAKDAAERKALQRARAALPPE